jgi:hypothetical protein
VLSRIVDHGYINAEGAVVAAKAPLRPAVEVSARRAFDEANTAILNWRADAILVGLSQRGVLHEEFGDVRRDQFVSRDGSSDIWVAESNSPGTRMLKTIQILRGVVSPPDVETPYANLPERFTDLDAIGDDWIDSTGALRLATEEARRNRAPTEGVSLTTALTPVRADPPEWTIRFRELTTDDIVYIVRIDAISQRTLLARAL